MVIGRIIYVSLGEFLCAKSEISLQTQENSTVGQESYPNDLLSTYLVTNYLLLITNF